MWTRRELKERAKVAFKRNYWRCVLVALLITLLTASFGLRSSQSLNGRSDMTAEEQRAVMLDAANTLDRMGDTAVGRAFFDVLSAGIRVAARTQIRYGGATAVVLGGLGILGLVLSVLVFNPLLVGCYRFFLQNSRGDGDLKHLGAGFKDNWGNVILVMFLKNLFTVLWTLLFIVPGIVKAYAYRLVPYILEERPELTGTQAITLSRQMMKGHKWDAFVLDLSFLGWILLSALTAGILGVFYVLPYINATDAELYEAVRRGYEPPTSGQAA